MKKFILASLCLTYFFANAQTVTVNPQTEKIKGEPAEGYGVELEGNSEEVNSAWNKFLRELGKPKSTSALITIVEPALGGAVYLKGVVYATSSGSAEKSNVWIGIKDAEWTVNDINVVKKDLENVVYRFGVKFYRDKIQAQIDEAQHASDAVDRKKQKLLNQNKDLTLKLSNNEQEKIRLEKALEGNKLEHEVLLVKIDENKNSQDSVAQAGVQIKKVLEMHKERLKKVN